MVKDYLTYIKENNILALPPHKGDDVVPPELNETKIIYTLKTLYSIEHNDVVLLSNRINSIIETGYYLKLRDDKTNIFYIGQNEPLVIFGVYANKSFSRGEYKNISCKTNTLVVNCKSDDSLYLFGENDFYRIQSIFIKPKRIITVHDPYGEEDWSEE